MDRQDLIEHGEELLSFLKAQKEFVERLLEQVKAGDTNAADTLIEEYDAYQAYRRQ